MWLWGRWGRVNWAQKVKFLWLTSGGVREPSLGTKDNRDKASAVTHHTTLCNCQIS